MNEITSLDVLLIAAAIVYSWRLYYSGQPPPAAGKAADTGSDTSPRLRTAGAGATTPATSLPDRLQSICRACGLSRIEDFTAGARSAHEAIVVGFARGELDGLPLAPDVRMAFTAEIAARQRRGEQVELAFVALEAADIVNSGIVERTAWISVRFRDLLATVTRDRNGRIVAGHPTTVGEVVETWTFERDMDARDPNWRLAATEANAGVQADAAIA